MADGRESNFAGLGGGRDSRHAQHQGIARRLPADERDAHLATVTGIGTRQIRRKPVLGGLISDYVAPPGARKTAGHLPEPIFERDKTGNLVPGAGRVAGQASEIIWDHAGW